MSETDKPPSSKIDMDSNAGLIPTNNTLARRFKSIRELWSGAWSIPPARSSLHSRCFFLSLDIQKVTEV